MVSLDKIVRGVLLQRGMSIHFYFQYLIYARDCLRELSCDVLKTLNYTLLDVDEWNEADLPDGYLDTVGVGFETGQHIRPLVQDNSLNSLVNYDAQGNRIAFNQSVITATPRENFLVGQENINYAWALNWGNGWNYYSRNDYGESLGRLYGYRSVQYDTYKIVKERNKIVINEDVGTGGKFVHTWIGDGSCCNSATCITTYAVATIEAYIKWQIRENSKAYSDGQSQWAKEEFKTQRRILIGRLSDINSMDDILRSMQQGYYNSQKT